MKSQVSKKLYPGINVQWPISQSILSGEKTIETRTYPLPLKYIGVKLALVETPGDSKKFKARVIAIVEFESSFLYKGKKEFYQDTAKHLVTPESKWAWSDKPKWGWKIRSVKKITEKIAPSKRGYVFTSPIEL